MNLDDLDPDARATLIDGAKRIRLARGESAYLAGDRADRVFFLRGGRVKIVRAGASGAESIVAIRSSGEMFGEPSDGDDAARSTSAVAIEPSEADAIAAATFAATLERDPRIGRAFARGAARRLAAAEHELAELMGKSVAGRLVDALGRLAERHGVLEPGGIVRIGINLTHRDLADLIGTSRETLTKELNVLADVGLLRVAHKTITLVQPQAFPFARRPADRPDAGTAR